jgi:hypothetical protein
MRLDVDAGAEPDTVAHHDEAGGRARRPGRDVGAKPVAMVGGAKSRQEVIVAHDGIDAEVAEGADDVTRAERHADSDPGRGVDRVGQRDAAGRERLASASAVPPIR